jgi:PKD repeat protein
MAFAYKNIYAYSSREGPMVLAWYQNGNYPDTGYSDGMRMVWFADTSVNPWGIHAFGNYDWHEAAAPEYWYYYMSGGENYPTTTGLSGKYISEVKIISSTGPVAPEAAFNSDVQTGTAPVTVQFTDASTGTEPLTYAWDFQNDGTIDSSLKDPSFTYEATGTYTVSMTVTNAAGIDTETKVDYITVTAPPVPPVADFSAAPISGLLPLTVQFTDQSTGIPTGWSWNFGDRTTSTDPSPSHTYLKAGTYTVTLTVTNDLGSSTVKKSKLITVLRSPVAKFIAAPTTASVGETITFTDQSEGDPTSWLWNFGDKGTDTVQNPTHAYQKAGTYTVTLKVTSQYGSDTVRMGKYIIVT